MLVLLHDGRLISVRLPSLLPPNRLEADRANFCTLLQGQLKGTDIHTNIILANAVERLFAADEPVEMVPLGLYLIRGENMCASLAPPLASCHELTRHYHLCCLSSQRYRRRG